MISFTPRLDNAVRQAARAHEHAKQHRKGSDVPYIIHPFGVMIIASNATDDEDILIACLMHDVLEDVSSDIYSESAMRADFGDRVVTIVLDVTKNDLLADWHERSRAYLHHLEHEASDEAVIVSASDKIHNLLSILTDYETSGEELWQRFTTKSSADQLWWYQSILAVITQRKVPSILSDALAEQVESLKTQLAAQ
ncbi:MAG: HD domain-containing protein [Candidatus Saccharibacteria bacterium]